MFACFDFIIFMRLCQLSEYRLTWTKSDLCALCNIQDTQLDVICTYLSRLGVDCVSIQEPELFTFPYKLVPMHYQGLQEKLSHLDIYYFMILASTNSYALQGPRIAARAQLVIAEYQTHGRGQYARQWHAAYASNVLLSYARCFEQRYDWSGFSVLVGTCLYKQLQQAYPQLDFSFKQPNDIFIAGRKLAGILVECSTQADRQLVVVGVGLNVNSPVIVDEQPWTSLYRASAQLQDRATLLIMVVAAIEQAFTQLTLGLRPEVTVETTGFLRD